jgi:hypothetical protein
MEDFTLAFAMLGILLYWVRYREHSLTIANFDQAAVIESFI